MTSSGEYAEPAVLAAGRRIHDLGELERAAIGAWDETVRGWVQDGAGHGAGMAANRRALARWAVRTRVLRDVSRVDTSTTILGASTDCPVLIAPSALHALVHPDGEVATARGALGANAIFVLSSGTSCPVEAVAATGARLWFQLYWGSDRTRVREVVETAADQGCEALCLTADMPVRPLPGPGMRSALASMSAIRPRYISPRDSAVRRGDWDHDSSLTWRDLEWLRSVSDLPLIVKGVMSASDVAPAVEAGVDGIIVSNHGGRAIDTPLGSVDVLPEITEAARAAPGRIDVYADGGFRHGTEVFTALALGARAVLVGRPALWSLAVGGADGVTQLLSVLRYQFAATMARAGVVTVADIGACHVRRTG